MSKMIKLSKSDWLRIGKEFGFFRQASPEDTETAGLPSQPPSVILLRGQDARRRLSEMGRRDETPRGSGLGEVPRRTSDFSDQVLWEMLDGPGGSGRGEGLMMSGLMTSCRPWRTRKEDADTKLF